MLPGGAAVVSPVTAPKVSSVATREIRKTIDVGLLKIPFGAQTYTAVSRKVVLQTGKSLRDNVESYYG